MDIGANVATAADAGDPSVTVSVSGSVNVTTVGTYIVTYNATDASGNKAEVTIEFKIVEAE